MILGNNCWIDIEKADKNHVVVVPLGSLEQHGHHLPLLTDTYLVTAVADRVEIELGDQIYMLPTLWLGSSDHHLDHPGTVSVSSALYTNMIKNIVRSIAKAGFRRVYFLNGHGGNIVPGTQAINELVIESKVYDDMWLALGSYWTVAAPEMSAELHGMASKQLSHACEYETSMMLSIQGELVSKERVTASPPLVDTLYYHSEHGGRVNVAKRLTTSAPTGAMGNPEVATAEKGESLLNAIAGEVVEFIRNFSTWK